MTIPDPIERPKESQFIFQTGPCSAGTRRTPPSSRGPATPAPATPGPTGRRGTGRRICRGSARGGGGGGRGRGSRTGPPAWPPARYPARTAPPRPGAEKRARTETLCVSPPPAPLPSPSSSGSLRSGVDWAGEAQLEAAEPFRRDPAWSCPY